MPAIRKIMTWMAASALAISLPALASQLDVNTLSDTDDGVCDAAHCSLREAWNAADASAGFDDIKFDLKGPGPYVIALDPALGGLAPATDSVRIKGHNKSEMVRVVAGNVGSDRLFVFRGPSDSEVRDLEMEGFERAIHAELGARVHVHGNVFDDNEDAVFLGEQNDFVPRGTAAIVESNRISNGAFGVSCWTSSLTAFGNELSGMSEVGFLSVVPIDLEIHHNSIRDAQTGIFYVFNPADGRSRAISFNTIEDSRGAAIVFSQANDLVLEGNQISSWVSTDWAVVEDVGYSVASRIVDNRITGHVGGILLLDDSDGLVQGNTIRDAYVAGGIANYFGWDTRILDNTITGTANTGIQIGNDARSNIVRGNYVGLHRDGTPDGNAGHGLYVGQVALYSFSLGPLIGPSLTRVEANVIAHNRSAGIAVSKDLAADCVDFNDTFGTFFVCSDDGVDAHASAALLGNSVFDNDAAGGGYPEIVLLTGAAPGDPPIFPFTGALEPCGGHGPPCTPLANDFLDADDGASSLQNHPTWVNVDVLSKDELALEGRLDSEPGEQYRIDVYSSSSPGEAREFLGYGITSVTDVNGNVVFSFEVELPEKLEETIHLTMTASRVVCEAGSCPTQPLLPFDGLYLPIREETQFFGGTSELSPSWEVTGD